MPTWMIVEDEPDIASVVQAMFAIWGYAGIAFADGPEAIAWIESLDRRFHKRELPELVLLDIRLPTMSGIEVSRRLRGNHDLGNIAIVLMTAYRLTPDLETDVLLMSGADCLLYKPLPGMAVLQKCVEDIVRQRNAEEIREPMVTATRRRL